MKFHLGDILSITTGKLLSPELIKGVYIILEYLTGERGIYTHQLGHCSKKCKPWLLRRIPFLGEIDVSGINNENYKEELVKLCDKYGEFHELIPIPKDEYEKIDPLKEEEKVTVNIPSDADLNNWFSYHTPTEQDIQDYSDIRKSALAFANTVKERCPNSPDKTVAIRKIREAVMVANASIACFVKR